MSAEQRARDYIESRNMSAADLYNLVLYGPDIADDALREAVVRLAPEYFSAATSGAEGGAGESGGLVETDDSRRLLPGYETARGVNELGRPEGDYEEQVRQAYTELLGREPDPEGLAFWSEQLRSGMPSDQMYDAFRASSEYQAPPGSQPVDGAPGGAGASGGLTREQATAEALRGQEAQERTLSTGGTTTVQPGVQPGGSAVQPTATPTEGRTLSLGGVNNIPEPGVSQATDMPPGYDPAMYQNESGIDPLTLFRAGGYVEDGIAYNADGVEMVSPENYDLYEEQPVTEGFDPLRDLGIENMGIAELNQLIEIGPNLPGAGDRRAAIQAAIARRAELIAETTGGAEVTDNGMNEYGFQNGLGDMTGFELPDDFFDNYPGVNETPVPWNVEDYGPGSDNDVTGPRSTDFTYTSEPGSGYEWNWDYEYGAPSLDGGGGYDPNDYAFDVYVPGQESPWGIPGVEGGNKDFYRNQFINLLRHEQNFQNRQRDSMAARQEAEANPLQAGEFDWGWLEGGLPEINVNQAGYAYPTNATADMLTGGGGQVGGAPSAPPGPGPSQPAPPGGGPGNGVDALATENPYADLSTYAGNDVNEAAVYALYNKNLGREPDPAGLAYYAAALADGTITPQEISNQIANSEEGRAYFASQNPQTTSGTERTLSTGGTRSPAQAMLRTIEGPGEPQAMSMPPDSQLSLEEQQALANQFSAEQLAGMESPVMSTTGADTMAGPAGPADPNAGMDRTELVRQLRGALGSDPTRDMSPIEQAEAFNQARADFRDRPESAGIKQAQDRLRDIETARRRQAMGNVNGLNENSPLYQRQQAEMDQLNQTIAALRGQLGSEPTRDQFTPEQSTFIAPVNMDAARAAGQAGQQAGGAGGLAPLWQRMADTGNDPYLIHQVATNAGNRNLGQGFGQGYDGRFAPEPGTSALDARAAYLARSGLGARGPDGSAIAPTGDAAAMAAALRGGA